MKSRKIKAIFASVLTVALLATAMTGFAANVSTTTRYNFSNDKIEVATHVTDATKDSEVTYLVKSGSTIVYIDQETATDGTVDFEYKIAKDKMSGYSSTVTFGTSADDNFTGNGSEDLGITLVDDVDGANYTITYLEAAAGYGETVNATIAAKEGYEITSVKVDGVEKGAVASVSVVKGANIEVEAVEAKKEAAISVFKTIEATKIGEETYSNVFTAVIVPQGEIDEFGVKYAFFDGITKYYASNVSNGTAAVQLILPDDKTANASEFTPYFIVDGVESNVATALN